MEIEWYTDYPFETLGDEPYKKAPIRKIKILSYDFNKYVQIKVQNQIETIKSGYLYSQPVRLGENPKTDRLKWRLYSSRFVPETTYE